MSITGLLLQVEVADWVVDKGSLLTVALKFLLDIAIVFLVVRVGYARGRNKPEFAFTYFTFNVLIFFLCYLMTHVDLSLGFAFGLFALFSIMRYRTMTIDIREMTYLFVVVSLGVLNSVTGAGTPVAELILINIAILATVLISEFVFIRRAVRTITLRYEHIDLVKKSNFPKLKNDLENRLGARIINIEIILLNYLTDSAELEVTFVPSKEAQPTTASPITSLQKEEKTIHEKVHS